MILSLGTSTHCRLYFEASALFKPSFCKASGVGDRTFCEKYGVAKMTPTQTEQNRRRKDFCFCLELLITEIALINLCQSNIEIIKETSHDNAR